MNYDGQIDYFFVYKWLLIFINKFKYLNKLYFIVSQEGVINYVYYVYIRISMYVKVWLKKI